MQNIIAKPLAYKVRTCWGRELSCTYVICSKEEQERTTAKKKLFLEYLEKSRGTVSLTCQKTGVARATYYVWWNKDLKFQKAVNEILAVKPDLLEDCLYAKALSGDTKALIYMLTHRHEDYKKPVENKETVVHIHHHATPPDETEDGEAKIGIDDMFVIVNPDASYYQNPYAQKVIKKYKTLIDFLKVYYKPKDEKDASKEGIIKEDNIKEEGNSNKTP